jgi:hypothetical protein
MRWFRRNNSRCRNDENLNVASTVVICSAGWGYECDVVACGWKEGIKLKGRGRKETVQTALFSLIPEERSCYSPCKLIHSLFRTCFAYQESLVIP